MNDTAQTPPDSPKTILILEDNLVRLEAMRNAVESSGRDFHVEHWDNAPQMIVEAPGHFPNACLISLDYDLSASRTTMSAGDGMDVVRFLIRHQPICAVIIHSTAAEKAVMMAQALRRHGWTVKQVPLSKMEVIAQWLAAVEELVSAQ